jgi:hypothetical protein
MTEPVRLRLDQLAEIDLMELEEELPEGAVERVPAELADGGVHGDLGLTAAVVILGAATVHALAVWLAKRRTRTQDELDLQFERSADGTVRLNVRSRLGHSASTPPDEAVVKALQSRLDALLNP